MSCCGRARCQVIDLRVNSVQIIGIYYTCQVDAIALDSDRIAGEGDAVDVRFDLRQDLFVRGDSGVDRRSGLGDLRVYRLILAERIDTSLSDQGRDVCRILRDLG